MAHKRFLLFLPQYKQDNASVSMSAYDRTSPHRGLVPAPDGRNIAPGTDPASGTVKEDFRNFGQRFSGADFCLRQSTASCIFVGQIPICPTKVLALRGRGVLPSQTPFPRYHGDRLKTG